MVLWYCCRILGSFTLDFITDAWATVFSNFYSQHTNADSNCYRCLLPSEYHPCIFAARVWKHCWFVLIHKPLQERNWTQPLLMSSRIAGEYNAGIIRCWQPYQNNKVRWKAIQWVPSVNILCCDGGLRALQPRSAVQEPKHPLTFFWQNDEGLHYWFSFCSV